MSDTISVQDISLLVILKLYLSEELPRCSSILYFFTCCLDEANSNEDKEHVLFPTLLFMCKSLKEAYLKQFKGSLYNIGDGKPVADKIQCTVLESLWGIKSADQLLRVVNDTYDYITQHFEITYKESLKVCPRSILGRFSQKLIISMRLLQFDECSQLFTNFCSYRQTTSELFTSLREQKNIGKTNISINYMSERSTRHTSKLDVVNGESSAEDSVDEAFYRELNTGLQRIDFAQYRHTSSEMSLSASHVDSLVENQIILLQRHGTSAPQALRSSLRRMAFSGFQCQSSDRSPYSELSSIHYLTYLEALSSGDYRGAFDALHRYFDYMVSKGSRYFYHFALISKASLHQSFGEHEKALNTIKEAISVARENRDNSTLTYILSWLFDFVRKFPSLWNNQAFNLIKNDSQLLGALVRKSQGISLSLAATSYRFESEYHVNSKNCFSKYYESLFKSNFLAINNHVVSFIGSCHVASKLWRLVGVFHLATLYTELGSFYSESYGTTLDVLEFRLHDNHLNNFSRDSGNIFSPFDNAATNKHHSLYYGYSFSAVQQLLKRGRFRIAVEMLNSLPVNDELEHEFRSKRLRLIASIQSAYGNYAEALAALGSLSTFSVNPRHPKHPHMIEFLEMSLLKCQVLIQSGNSMKALSPLLQLIGIGRNFGFLSILSEGSLCLTQVLGISGNTLDAYTFALALVPWTFCVGDVSVTSSVMLQLAELCLQLLLDDTTPKGMTERDLFHQCLNCLSLSISGFKKSEDLQMLARCFELERRISSQSFSHESITNASLLVDFEKHSRTGLEILKRRMMEQSGEGYLEKFSI